jgi:hypothetical protein
MVAWRRESVGGEMVAATPWARQGSGGHYLRAVGAVRTRSALGSDRAADGGPHAVLIFFNLTKTGSNLEFEKECLTYSKNSKILYDALDWGAMKNSVNCANIQISTELELKFLEQIHHFKFH